MWAYKRSYGPSQYDWQWMDLFQSSIHQTLSSVIRSQSIHHTQTDTRHDILIDLRLHDF